jgi:hypothetical protein
VPQRTEFHFHEWLDIAAHWWQCAGIIKQQHRRLGCGIQLVAQPFSAIRLFSQHGLDALFKFLLKMFLHLGDTSGFQFF